MRIAVIGATGNVGTALLRRLHSAEEVTSILGISRRGPDRTGEPYDGVEWQRADISKPASAGRLTELLRGADAVVHLAWAIRPNRDEAFLRATNVDGARRVFEAAAAAGVPHLVVASSVGAYGRADGAPGPASPQSEDYPVFGTPSSHYGRQKAEVERVLDAVGAAHPQMRIARLRPGLIFQADAGPEIRDYFLGSLAPRPLLRALAGGRLPLLPWPAGLLTQTVHADDIAEAYWQVVRQGASGAFNIATDPVVGPDAMGTALGARRWLPVPVPLVRAALSAAYALRLVPTDPGWIDMAMATPVMSTERARSELGWMPRHDAVTALGSVIAHLADDGGLGNALHRSQDPWE